MIGGPPVRPLDRFQTRVVGDTLEVGPRYSVTNDLEPVRARDPGEFTGGIWEYLYPPRSTTAARRPDAEAAPDPPQARQARRAHQRRPPQRRRRRRARRRAGRAGGGSGPRQGQGGRDRRRRLGRRAHRRDPVPHRDAAAQGPEGDQLVLHARLGDPVRVRDAGAHRRLPRDVLRALVDRGLQLDHPPDQRRLPRRVRPRPAQVGRDADDHPDLPPHGRGPSSSAPTSTRASSTG